MRGTTSKLCLAFCVNNMPYKNIEDRKRYYQLYKKEKKKYSKEYRRLHKEEYRIYDREYYQLHKQEKKIYNSSRKKEACENRCKHIGTLKGGLDNRMRTAIYLALKGNKAGRSWESLVGYTIDDLKIHLEKQFDKNMSWDNCGKYEEGKFRWHIDHIKPKSLFKYKNPEDKEFKECWVLKNLRPLEAVENMRKSNHYEE